MYSNNNVTYVSAMGVKDRMVLVSLSNVKIAIRKPDLQVWLRILIFSYCIHYKTIIITIVNMCIIIRNVIILNESTKPQ